MRSRFFTLASRLLVSLTLVGSAEAQVETPTATPKPTPAPGYIRFWNMLPSSAGALDLRRTGGSPTDPPLIGQSPSYRYNTYLECPVGVYHLAVNKAGESDKVLKAVDVNLTANFFFTVLVGPTPEGPSVQLINDTSNPKAETAALTVRNYFPGIAVDVFDGAKKIVTALPFGQSFVVANLPFDRLPLTIKTILPNKVAAESGAEADFKMARRATLLIIPDEYGRFRPRVTLDGTNR
jgi:hypothetical protein